MDYSFQAHKQSPRFPNTPTPTPLRITTTTTCSPGPIKCLPPPAVPSITWQGIAFAFCDRRGADSTEIQRVVQHGIYSAEYTRIAASGKCRGTRAIPAVLYASHRIFFLVKKNQYVCQIGKYSAFNTLWKAWTASNIHISSGLSNTQTQILALKQQLSKPLSNPHTGSECPSHTGTRTDSTLTATPNQLGCEHSSLLFFSSTSQY